MPPGGSTSSPRGGDVGPDLTVWDFWWGFNKDPYLNLKTHIYGGTMTGDDDFFLGSGEKRPRNSLRPSESDVRGRVVPALLELLRTERSNDIVTAAMMALAKIGDVGVKPGERVKVKGVWAEINGHDIFMAAKIKKGDYFEFKVRLTSDGTPFWTMTPEQLEKERAASQASLNK